MSTNERPHGKASLAVVVAVATVATLSLTSGCATAVKPGPPPTFADAGSAPAPGADAFPNWPVPPDEAERLLRSGKVEVRSEKHAGAGVTGAARFKVYWADIDREFKVKWKPVPASGDGWNNSPRKELAGYRLQALVLDPHEWPIPTSEMRCLTEDDFAIEGRTVTPQLKGFDCELGVFSLWLEDVTVPDPLWDADRFRADPLYAHYLSNLNVVTLLSKNRDGRKGNFLVSADDSRPQYFAIDNGIAFSGLVYNYLVPNWHVVRLPALRAESIARMRDLDREDLDETLGVVAELGLDEDGVLRAREHSENWDPRKGVRLRADGIQFGLTASEIDGVYERLQDLLADVDAGKVATF